MQNDKVVRQMPERSDRAGRRRGEAGPSGATDETRGTLHEHPDTGRQSNWRARVNRRARVGLLETALTRQNLQAAWKWGKANKGGAGVDGLDIAHTKLVLRTKWPSLCQALLQGS